MRGHCGGPACSRRHQPGVNVVYFLLQVAIVFASTHHMTPGHSLLIRPVLDPLLSTVTKTHTQSRTQMHTMGCLLAPASVQEASSADWRALTMMLLAWSRMCPTLTPEPRQCGPLMRPQLTDGSTSPPADVINLDSSERPIWNTEHSESVAFAALHVLNDE